MPGFFEAFDSSKPVVKKHTVTIQGNEVEVSLGKKLEIMRAGEDKYILKAVQDRFQVSIDEMPDEIDPSAYMIA